MKKLALKEARTLTSATPITFHYINQQDYSNAYIRLQINHARVHSYSQNSTSRYAFI